MTPASLRRVVARLRALVAAGRADRELERELAAHVAIAEEDFVRRGLPAAEARAAAERVVRPDHIRELHREARSFPWLEDLRRDVPYALRGLRRTPGFTVAAVLTLALGIGATTAVFSVVHGVLLKPLPYSPWADRLVRISAHVPDNSSSHGERRIPASFSASELAELDAGTRTLSHVGTFNPGVIALSGHEDGARLRMARLSASVFPMLDARPLIGRVFGAADERPEADPVVILAYSAWRRYFAADPGIIGRTVMLDSVVGARRRRGYTVVGVMPPSFSFPSPLTQLWTSWQISAGSEGPAARMPLLARLAEGVSLDAALAELQLVVPGILQHPRDVRYELVYEHDELVGRVRPALAVLAGAVGLLLLTACVNVANILLARSSVRQREMAVRSALGASRGRLIRQALTECGVLALVGGAAGVLLALGAVDLLRVLVDGNVRIDLPGSATFPRIDDVTVDGTVLAFTAALATLTGLLVGMGPAVRGARPVALQHASRITPRSHVRSLLVVVQVALTTALLVTSALVINSFVRLMSVDPGYASSGVQTFQVSLPADRYSDARLMTFAEEMSGRLRAFPGVRAAAFANQLPMVSLRDTGGGLWRTPAADRPAAPDGADARLVSRDYLEVMGIPVIAGRGFEDRDGAGQPRVVLINRTLAAQEFPKEEPVGQIVYVGRDPEPWTVIGVTDDVRQFGLDRAPEPQFFVDLRQGSGGFPLFPVGAYYAARTDLDTAAFAAHLRTIVRQLDPEAALFNVAPMDSLVSHTLVVPRMNAVLLGLFAAVGLALALVGIYGVLAYTVLQRTREIGVRMALGARASQVLRQVMRQGLVLAMLGLAAGLAGAAALSRFLESLLYEVTPLDTTTYGAVALVFVLAAALASWVPSRRATQIDPAITLRCE